MANSSRIEQAVRRDLIDLKIYRYDDESDTKTVFWQKGSRTIIFWSCPKRAKQRKSEGKRKRDV